MAGPSQILTAADHRFVSSNTVEGSQLWNSVVDICAQQTSLSTVIGPLLDGNSDHKAFIMDILERQSKHFITVYTCDRPYVMKAEAYYVPTQ